MNADPTVLRQHGVTADTLETLRVAGYDGLEKLARATRSELLAVPGMSAAHVASVRRAVGRLIDIGHRTRG